MHRVLIIVLAIAIPLVIVVMRRANDDSTRNVPGAMAESAPPAFNRSHENRPQVATRADRAAELALEMEQILALKDESRHSQVLNELLPELVRLRPEAAANLLENIEPSVFRDDYLQRLATLWEEHDPSSALNWAAQVEDQSERFKAVRAVAVQMAHLNAQSAVLALTDFGVPAEKKTLADIAQFWASSDASAAKSWALSQPAGEIRDAVVTRIGFAMSEQDPREAAEFVLKNTAASEARIESAISILHRWARQDWNMAKAWADQFPEGPLRERAQNELTAAQQYATSSQ